MKKNIKHIKDKKGNITDVVVPVELWRALIENYKSMMKNSAGDDSWQGSLKKYTKKTGRRSLDISDLFNEG